MKDLRFAVGADVVITDIEGTVLDNKRFHRKIIWWYAFFKLPGLLYISSCTLFSYFFRKVPFLKNYEKLGTRLDRIIFDLFEIADNRVEIYRGAKQVLEELCENGVVLFATTTSNTERTKERLGKLKLLELFRGVLGSERISKSEHIASFASHMGVTEEEFVRRCLFYVGDGPLDMKIAREKGILAIGITKTLYPKTLIFWGAEKVINNLGELLKLLKLK